MNFELKERYLKPFFYSIGKYIINQLKDSQLGDELIIPKVMLKADEPVFLDDLTVSDVEKALNVKISSSANDGFEYLDKVLGISY